MQFSKETRWFYLNGVMKQVLSIPILWARKLRHREVNNLPRVPPLGRRGLGLDSEAVLFPFTMLILQFRLCRFSSDSYACQSSLSTSRELQIYIFKCLICISISLPRKYFKFQMTQTELILFPVNVLSSQSESQFWKLFLAPLSLLNFYVHLFYISCQLHFLNMP